MLKTIYQIYPNAAVREWLEENCECLWLGGSLCVGTNYIGGIVQALIDAGFEEGQGKDFVVY